MTEDYLSKDDKDDKKDEEENEKLTAQNNYDHLIECVRSRYRNKEDYDKTYNFPTILQKEKKYGRTTTQVYNIHLRSVNYDCISNLQFIKLQQLFFQLSKI